MSNLMSQPHETDRELHRVIITRRRGAEILRISTGADWTLPCVEILSRHRPADQITDRVREQYGLDAYCVLNLTHPESDKDGRERRYVVMEVIDSDENAPGGCQWFRPSGTRPQVLESAEDDVAIQEALRQTGPRAARTQPFSQLGWLDDLLAWVRRELNPLGLQLSGAIHQFNAGPTFSLIRMETNGPAIWFKATGEPNRHELSVSQRLSRLFPNFVPEILAVHFTWNGWLAKEASGTLLSSLNEAFDWKRVAETLAELQIASVPTCTELLNSGCRDLRLPNIAESVDPFIVRMSDLMVAQTKRPPEPLTDENLELLGEKLKSACALLQESGLPDTLGHVDFNPGNIIVSPTGCCFLDWAEGCVTHPLVTFEYLREHTRRAFLGDDAVIEQIVSAYLQPWRSRVSADTITQALAISPMIAVFVAAIVDSTWSSVDPLLDSDAASYFRSLTRRMFRESARLVEAIGG
jgi:hypothetical protein